MVPFGFAFGLGFPRPPHQDLEDNRVRVCQGHMPQLSANPILHAHIWPAIWLALSSVNVSSAVDICMDWTLVLSREVLLPIFWRARVRAIRSPRSLDT